MSEPTTRASDPTAPGQGGLKPGWGPKLFLSVLAAALAFFWWLLIWSGGVTPVHG